MPDEYQTATIDSLIRDLKRTKEELHYANEKWRDYEHAYILPTFTWAKEIGFDLEAAVSTNPGHNCVELLVRHLIDTYVNGAD